jgi:hypothetical protein
VAEAGPGCLSMHCPQLWGAAQLWRIPLHHSVFRQVPCRSPVRAPQGTVAAEAAVADGKRSAGPQRLGRRAVLQLEVHVQPSVQVGSGALVLRCCVGEKGTPLPLYPSTPASLLLSWQGRAARAISWGFFVAHAPVGDLGTPCRLPPISLLLHHAVRASRARYCSSLPACCSLVACFAEFPLPLPLLPPSTNCRSPRYNSGKSSSLPLSRRQPPAGSSRQRGRRRAPPPPRAQSGCRAARAAAWRTKRGRAPGRARRRVVPAALCTRGGGA